MNKRQVLILLYLFIAIIISSCSHKGVYLNSWQNGDFKVPSKSETSEPLSFYDAKSKLQYQVSNDFKNLYICLKATDQQSQMKIIRAGMTVGIDTLGKKSTQVEILFPFPAIYQKDNSSNTSTENKKDWHNKSDTGNQRKHFMSQYSEIHLSGFKPPINGVLPLHNVYGIYVNITWDSLNIMYYKAIIPFKTFFKDSLIASDSSRIFDFSVTVNGITMQHLEGGESGSHGGGMGGMHGGMHGGGGQYGSGGYGSDDRSSMFETTHFYSRIKLVTHPQPK
ncbi:MAG: hypothetical protein ABR968_06910 [Bacteroidales bacterium]|jgi:hypothetical protein